METFAWTIIGGLLIAL